jgi:hypothetical protein
MQTVFERDDVRYLRWKDEHPNGYVLNLLGTYAMLHSSSCYETKKLSYNAGKINPLTGRYIKVCGDNVDELILWMERNHAGVEMRRCKKC